MKKIFRNGISIRVVHIAMLACAAAIVGLLIYSTVQSSNVFTTLSAETDNYIVRQKAADDLMEASDYLTERFQLLTTLDGTDEAGREDIQKYISQYFEEAFTSQRRENAVKVMAENHADESLTKQLEEALNESRSLMGMEKKAMYLICDLYGIDTIYMSELDPFSPSPEEDVKSDPESKKNQAQMLVMGNDYYASKEIIRTKLKNALEMMDEQMSATRRKTSADMMKTLSINRTMIIVMVVVLGGLILLTAVLSTIPLITANRCRRDNKRIPMIGSKEFRAMAESYNEMYDKLHSPPKDEE